MNATVTLADELVNAGRRLDILGFLAGSDGNLSGRLPNGRILVTPAGVAKGELSNDMLVELTSEGSPVNSRDRPSSELRMHLAVYEARAEITACVHSHPPYATAFAVAGEELPDNILPEAVVFAGGIAMTDYAPPGTESVPAALEPFLATHQAFLLRNHGLLTIGSTVTEALHRHETVEHLAHILFLARALGRPGEIPAEDLKRLRRMHRDLTVPRQD